MVQIGLRQRTCVGKNPIVGKTSANGRIQFDIMATLSMLLVLMAFTKLAFGQAEQGTITGIVRDASGAVVASAKVTALEMSTKTLTSTVSNSNGYYTIPYLAHGTYDVTADALGFSKTVVTGVNLTVNLNTAVDLTLKVGGVSQQVTVQANAIQLETENSQLGQTYNRQQIIAIPGRGGYNLDLLSPGVLPEQNSALQAQINGGMANTSNVLLDGGTQVNSSTGDIALTPPTESIGEFKLITNNFSAEYGMSGGGIITATTMSGTNDFHGSAYEYNSNTLYNANGWYRNSVKLPRAPVHNNLFGFSVAGPLEIPKIYHGRNRTFYFFNIEWNPSVSPDAIQASVPTQAMRIGDFSGLVDQSGKQIKIYDPTTTTLVPGQTNKWTRSQFSCNGVLNVICPGRINSIAQKVLSYYPLPNTTGIEGIYNNYVASPSRTTSKDNFFARVDQNIGANHKAFVRVGRASSKASTPTVTLAFPQAGGNGDPGTFLNTAWTGVVSDTWTMRSNLVGEFRGNFNRVLNQTQMYSQGFDAGSLGFPGSFVSRVATQIFPAFTISDESPLGATSSSYFNDAEGSYEGQAHFTWNKGAHTLKTGVDYLFVYFNEFRPTWPAGNFSFSRGYVQGPDPSVSSVNSGWGFASLLLGVPSGGQITKDPSLTASQKNIASYLQDDWKVVNHLTLNLGLRYDILTGFTDRHNQFAWFDPTKPDPVLGLPGALQFAGVGGNPRNQTDTKMTNFSPRLGFAWQIGQNTVIRGGYGIIYTTNTGGSVLGSGPQASTSVYLGPPSPAPNTPPPGGTLNNPFASGYLDPPNYLVGQGIGDPFWPGTLPYLQDRTLSVERALTGNTVLTVAYAGSRGLHLWYSLPRNVAPISALSYGPKLYQQVPNPYAGKLPGSLGAPTIPFSQTLVPFPQYTGVTWSRDPVGDSYYDAMTVQLHHRDAHGLYFQIAYTLSKDINNINERYNGRGGAIVDPNNLARTRGLAEYDRPQFLNINYIYQLPFGPGHRVLGRGLASKMIANWQLAGVTAYGSGLPIVITAPSNTYLPGITAVADRLHDPHLKTGQTPQRWFDTTAYAIPASFTVGTGNRIEPDLRGPAYGQWDMGLARKQTFADRVTLELRFDALNVFNNRQLSPPNGSVTGGTFGQITASGQARSGQVKARLTW
ncbi:TonB-dependent receptor [Edaphobacter albus]|uniref:TonB-dependent receptor n=1 Tax=Edaphobacter sp. 4G125 TaxID=2763071 RepID=UPI00351C30F2